MRAARSTNITWKPFQLVSGTNAVTIANVAAPRVHAIDTKVSLPIGMVNVLMVVWVQRSCRYTRARRPAAVPVPCILQRAEGNERRYCCLGRMRDYTGPALEILDLMLCF